jgi:hypothetical protein
MTQFPLVQKVESSVADPGMESGAFLAPGSRIRDEHPRSYFRELRNNFLVYQYRYFSSLMLILIRDLRPF